MACAPKDTPNRHSQPRILHTSCHCQMLEALDMLDLDLVCIEEEEDANRGRDAIVEDRDGRWCVESRLPCVLRFLFFKVSYYPPAEANSILFAAINNSFPTLPGSRSLS
jgi:hypothetical protein